MKELEMNQTMEFPAVVRFFLERKLSKGYLYIVLEATSRESGYALVDAEALEKRMTEIGQSDLFNQLSCEVVTSVKKF